MQACVSLGIGRPFYERRHWMEESLHQLGPQFTAIPRVEGIHGDARSPPFTVLSSFIAIPEVNTICRIGLFSIIYITCS